MFLSDYERIKQQTRRKNPVQLWPTWLTGQPIELPVNLDAYVEEGYGQNALVFSALRYKTRQYSQAKLRAYTGDPDNPDLLPAAMPLSHLLKYPNPEGQSLAQILALWAVFYDLAGIGYIYLDRKTPGNTPGNVPDALWVLRPDWVTTIPGASGQRIGYLYGPAGMAFNDKMPILPDELAIIKVPNAGDVLGGLGPGQSSLSAGARSANVDNMVTDFLDQFFRRGSMVTGLLSYDVPMQPDDVTQARERWQETFGGYRNWDIAILDQGGKYERVGLTFDEMGFKDIDQRNETRTLMGFGVSPVLVGALSGLANATYSNLEGMRRLFWQDVALADLEEMRFALEIKLSPHDSGTFLNFDISGVPALQENVPQMVTAAQQLFAIGYPRDVAARAVGLSIEPTSDGEQGYLPLSLMPVGGGEEQPGGAGTTGAQTPENQEAIKTARLPFPVKAWTPDAKQRHARRTDGIARSWERRFTDEARDQFETDRREYGAIVDDEERAALRDNRTPDIGNLWPAVVALNARRTAEWARAFDKVLRGVMGDQVQAWADAVPGLPTPNLTTLLSQEWYKAYPLRFATQPNQTTLDWLKLVFDQATREGWSINKLGKALEAGFDVFASNAGLSEAERAWFIERLPTGEQVRAFIPGYRAEMIARTETMRAANAATYAQFEDWGVKQIEWVTVMDDRTRGGPGYPNSEFTHWDANGEITDIGAPFKKTGEDLLFPGDPEGSAANTINCRCSVIPVLEG